MIRPRDTGAPHGDYFRALNIELQRNGPARPCLVLDLDRLDRNIEVIDRSIRAPMSFRVVAKSLPSIPLLRYIFDRAKTQRLMAFHQPFLNAEAEAFPRADILLGKPMPVRAAAEFYELLRGSFDPSRQLHWLIDTPERLQQYLVFAEANGLRLRLNIEIDTGLHRGGIGDERVLAQMLGAIASHPMHAEFAGFMGYDAQVIKLPAMLGTHKELHAKTQARYQAFCNVVRTQYPALWHDGLTLNAAGSPTYRLYEGIETPVNDLSVGSALVKPTDFDLGILSEHVPALFIATPVLKVQQGTKLPGIAALGELQAWWNPNRQRTYFTYGGHWMARYESPAGLRGNELFGYSTNQEFVNGSDRTALAPDDYVFLRPTQSEAVMLQFGSIVTLRDGKVSDRWQVLQQMT